MKRLLRIVSACFCLVLVGRLASAQTGPYVEHPGSVKPAACGAVSWEPWPGAPNAMHGYYNLDYSWAQPGMIYTNPRSHERVFKFTLDSASYVYIKQMGKTLQDFYLLGDSSNARLLARPSQVINQRLAAGTYFLSVEDNWGYADPYYYPQQDIPIQITCSPTPIVYPTDARPYAADAPINRQFQTTINGAGSHLDRYIAPVTTYWGYHYPIESYLPQQERVLRFTIPDSSQLNISVNTREELFCCYGLATFLMDSTGNTLTAFSPSGSYPAGTYYLSIEQGSTTYVPVEQGSTTMIDSVDVFIGVRKLLPGCAPRIDPPFNQYIPDYYPGSISGTINDFSFENNVNGTYGRYTSRHKDLYASMDGAPLTIFSGGFSNLLRGYFPDSVLRIYADLNSDGDFSDTAEELWRYRVGRDRISMKTLGIVLPTRFDSIYRANAGKPIRLRLLQSRSDSGGACDRTEGAAIDFQAVLSLPPPGPYATRWVRTLTNIAGTAYQHVTVAPSGNIIAAGWSDVNRYNPGQIWATSDSQLRFDNGDDLDSLYILSVNHHYVMTDILAFAGYYPDGRLRWAKQEVYYTCADGQCGTSSGETAYLSNASAKGPDGKYAVSGTIQTTYYGSQPTLPKRGTIHILSDTGVAGYISLGESCASNVSGCAYGADTSFYYCGYAAPDQGQYYWARQYIIGAPAEDSAKFNFKGEQDGYLQATKYDRPNWLLKAESPDDESFAQVATTPDGAILATGYFKDSVNLIGPAGVPLRLVRADTADSTSAFIVSVSPAGEPLWAKAIPRAFAGADMVACKDTSGVLLAGFASGRLHYDSLAAVSDTIRDAYVLKIGSNGKGKWLRFGGTGGNGTAFTRLDSAGNLLWSYFVGISRDTAFGEALAAGNQTGQILITLDAATGRQMPGPGLSLIGPDKGYVADLAPLPGGDVVLAGSSNNGVSFAGLGNYAPGGYLARVSLTGAPAPPPTTAVQRTVAAARPGLTVYPNPSTGEVWVRLAGAKAAMPLEVTDALGRSVLTAQPTAAALAEGFALPKTLPRGFYAVHCGKAAARVVVE